MSAVQSVMGWRLAAMALGVLLVSACSDSSKPTSEKKSSTTVPAVSAPVAVAEDMGPPTENGVYVSHNGCEGEGGCWNWWRAEAVIQLQAIDDATSPVVATLAPGDWVVTVDTTSRKVLSRGVVQRDDQELKAGDVVYLLSSEGEGEVTLWRRGKQVAWTDAGEGVVTWDPVDPNIGNPAMLGTWFKLRVEKSGASGWVRDVKGFECVGPLQGSVNCRDENGKRFQGAGK